MKEWSPIRLLVSVCHDLEGLHSSNKDASICSLGRPEARPSMQGLANMLWAFAKLEQPAPALCEAAASEVVRRLHSFSLRDLSQILWAFAKLEHRRSPQAVSAIADHTAAILREEGSNPVTSLAQLVLRIGCLQRAPPLLHGWVSLGTGLRTR